MDWHCWTLLLVTVSTVAFPENTKVLDGIQEKRLSFHQHSKCTYSYELAVHTARGSKSTESDGFQIYALVRSKDTVMNYLVSV